jgi:hypothetical protein
MIAQALRIHETSIVRHLSDFINNKKTAPNSGGSGGYLGEEQTRKTSLNTDELLLFMDAVHPTQATQVTAGWIRKGVDKSIETTGSRTRLYIVGAIRLGHLSEAVIVNIPPVYRSGLSPVLSRKIPAKP